MAKNTPRRKPSAEQARKKHATKKKKTKRTVRKTELTEMRQAIENMQRECDKEREEHQKKVVIMEKEKARFKSQVDVLLDANERAHERNSNLRQKLAVEIKKQSRLDKK